MSMPTCSTRNVKSRIATPIVNSVHSRHRMECSQPAITFWRGELLELSVSKVLSVVWGCRGLSEWKEGSAYTERSLSITS